MAVAIFMPSVFKVHDSANLCIVQLTSTHKLTPLKIFEFLKTRRLKTSSWPVFKVTHSLSDIVFRHLWQVGVASSDFVSDHIPLEELMHLKTRVAKLEAFVCNSFGTLY